jgi:ketosteroid isomerase-like protein
MQSQSELIAQQIQNFYLNFNQASINALAEIYHSEVEFVDPIHQVSGLSALQQYFANILHGVDYCHFEFAHSSVNNDQVFLTWHMRFRHPNLGKGDEIVVPGVSHCQLRDERVIYQRDFYDAGAMVYEHLPVLRFIIAKIKQRLNSA